MSDSNIVFPPLTHNEKSKSFFWLFIVEYYWPFNSTGTVVYQIQYLYYWRDYLYVNNFKSYIKF